MAVAVNSLTSHEITRMHASTARSGRKHAQFRRGKESGRGRGASGVVLLEARCPCVLQTNVLISTPATSAEPVAPAFSLTTALAKLAFSSCFLQQQTTAHGAGPSLIGQCRARAVRPGRDHGPIGGEGDPSIGQCPRGPCLISFEGRAARHPAAPGAELFPDRSAARADETVLVGTSDGAADRTARESSRSRREEHEHHGNVHGLAASHTVTGCRS